MKPPNFARRGEESHKVRNECPLLQMPMIPIHATYTDKSLVNRLELRSSRVGTVLLDNSESLPTKSRDIRIRLVIRPTKLRIALSAFGELVEIELRIMRQYAVGFATKFL